MFEGREGNKIEELLGSNTEDNVKELLQGIAKYCIPDTLEIVHSIYKVLGKDFGNLTRPPNYKKRSLTKFVTSPSYDIKGGTKVVVDWYLGLESQLQSLLDMGQVNSDSTDPIVVIHLLEIIWTVADMFEEQKSEMCLTSVQRQQGRVCL